MVCSDLSCGGAGQHGRLRFRPHRPDFYCPNPGAHAQTHTDPTAARNRHANRHADPGAGGLFAVEFARRAGAGNQCDDLRPIGELGRRSGWCQCRTDRNQERNRNRRRADHRHDREHGQLLLVQFSHRQTVCVANNTDVYVITGTTLSNTLTSGSNALESFSGGSCNNCGVVVDSSTNKALITMGLTPNGPGGYQFLDLGSTPPAFEPPIPAGTNTTSVDTSEDASIDPIRHLVLSPNEANNYQIINTSAGTTKPAIFNNDLSSTVTTGEFDSAGEDCTTGIALATIEFTGDLYIADLTQATFNSVNQTWTDAASQVQSFPEFSSFAAGTCGIAVAPGTHLGIVTGEFGGDLEGVIQLPATSGSGIPAVTDWVSFTVPSSPTGAPWEEGFDPHTVTAYVSPNTGKAYGVLENSSNTLLAVVDLQGLLSAPRTGHVVNTPIPSGLITFVAE